TWRKRLSRSPPASGGERPGRSDPPAAGGPGKHRRWCDQDVRPFCRCALAEAYRQTAAAAPRLRLSARPWIGTRTRWSAWSSSGAGNPCASEPNTQAVGAASAPESARSSRSVSPWPVAASTWRPAPRNSASAPAGRSCRTRSRWNRLPAVARTHLPLYGSTAGPAKITAPAPAASAVRSTVPALPGSVTSTSTATSPGRCRSAVASGTSRRSQTATTPCGVTASVSAPAVSSVIRETGTPASPAVATRSGWRAAARSVRNNSRTVPGRASASRTACGPSARNRPVRSRSRRRRSLAAATTRRVRRVKRPACGALTRWDGSATGLGGGAGATGVLGGDGRAGGGDQGVERGGVVDRQVSPVLAVDLDSGQAESLDQPVVAHAVGARPGVDPGDPQSPEVTLAVLAVPVGVLHRVQHLLLGLAVEPGALAPVPLGALRDRPALLARVHCPLDACHLSSPPTGRGSAAQQLLDPPGVRGRGLVAAREPALAARGLPLQLVHPVRLL